MDYLSLCLICKDENDYLPEWLDYHIVMGVERFYIYDNQSRVSLQESLREYIQKGWVVVTEITGKAMQLHAYDHCLRAYGQNTAWLGFIDTDEFLVPKATLDLRDLLKSYEGYGGLAVSSLFFGSNGQKERPKCGQIAAYSTRTHEMLKENTLVKSIVQPAHVVMPASPHDFIYKEKSWAVNENFQRVDYQRFPNSIQKIQLNHYFCRSESEIIQKLTRGPGDAVKSWPRKRFDEVNRRSLYTDRTILDILARKHAEAAPEYSGAVGAIQASEVTTVLASLAGMYTAAPLPGEKSSVFSPGSEMETLLKISRQIQLAQESNQRDQSVRLILEGIQAAPNRPFLYVDLAVNFSMQTPDTAWQALSMAWQIAPNSYWVLNGMTFYFLKVGNFEMAAKTSRMMLEIAPKDLTSLAYLTDALLGLGNYVEAIQIGIPVIEQAHLYDAVSPQLCVHLARRMSAYLMEQRAFAQAAHLWEQVILCGDDSLEVLLELTNALCLSGDFHNARRCLAQAQSKNTKQPDALIKIDQLRRQINLNRQAGKPRKR